MDIYLHKHHIVPRHAGGTDEPENLVELTILDHAIAHRALWKMYGRWQDKIAWQMLSGQIDNYEAQQEARRLANLGKKLSEEHKQKISKSKKNPTKKTREKMSKSKMGNQHRVGHKHSYETKEICRQAALNQTNHNSGGYTLSDEFKDKCRQRMLTDNPAKRPEVREKLRQAALRREQKKRGAEAPL